MIRGLHGMFYSSDAEAARAFLRDKLQLPFTDVGEGWLIFDLPEADVGIHPSDEANGGMPGDHDVSFYCDDIEGTVAELRGRGVEFKGEVADHGYGFVTYFSIPGGIEVQLYQPKYQKRVRAPRKPAAVKVKQKTVTRTRARATAARGARKKKPARGKRR